MATLKQQQYRVLWKIAASQTGAEKVYGQAAYASAKYGERIRCAGEYLNVEVVRQLIRLGALDFAAVQVLAVTPRGRELLSEYEAAERHNAL